MNRASLVAVFSYAWKPLELGDEVFQRFGIRIHQVISKGSGNPPVSCFISSAMSSRDLRSPWFTSQDKVFQHGNISAVHADRVDLDLHNLLPAVYGHVDHAASGRGGHGFVGELFLYPLHLFLHLLHVFHEFLKIEFHTSHNTEKAGGVNCEMIFIDNEASCYYHGIKCFFPGR